jgi:hypothetical protein
MIKRYNQFIKNKTNEDINEEDFMSGTSFEETETDLSNRDLENEVDDFQESEMDNTINNELEEEEEAGDFYNKKIKELAKMLNVEAEDRKVEFEGKEIIFPSETEMYHVDKKKFKTAKEVVDYLNSMNKNKIPKFEEELELQESKSYKNRFRKK